MLVMVPPLPSTLRCYAQYSSFFFERHPRTTLTNDSAISNWNAFCSTQYYYYSTLGIVVLYFSLYHNERTGTITQFWEKKTLDHWSMFGEYFWADKIIPIDWIDSWSSVWSKSRNRVNQLIWFLLVKNIHKSLIKVFQIQNSVIVGTGMFIWAIRVF